MSRGNAGGNPANRTVGGHIKEGLKQIPATYKGLYKTDANSRMAVRGPAGGVVHQNVPFPKAMAKTMAGNVKFIAKGRPEAPLAGNARVAQAAADKGSRAKMALMGAASVTPAGPIAAFGIGVNKSINAKKNAIAEAKKPGLQAAAKQLGATGKATVGAGLQGKSKTMAGSPAKAVTFAPGTKPGPQARR